MSSPPPATACGPKVAAHEPEIVRHERVWGPVPSDRTEARHAASSVLIRPHDVQLERCRKNVLAEVPAGVLPMADDTPKTLSSRLAKSDWLDSIHALKGGNGKGNMRRVALNATDYAQPRRVTMSVPAGGVHVDGDGDSVQSLYGYSHYGRLPEDTRCRQMSKATLELMHRLWHIAKPYLREQSRRTPPTACQILFYYAVLGGRIGRHRDMFRTQDVHSFFEGGQRRHPFDSRESFSQVGGSEVLVWTEGNAVLHLKLSYADPRNPSGGKQSYIVSPELTVPCASGTLFIFTPWDDFFFCHEASFADVEIKAVGAAGHRIAYVFRWLGAARNYYAEPSMAHGLKLTIEEHNRKRARTLATARARASGVAAAQRIGYG